MKQNSLKTIPKIFVVIMLCFVFSNCKNKNHKREVASSKDSIEYNGVEKSENMKNDYRGNEKANKRQKIRILPSLRNKMRSNFSSNYGINIGFNIDTVPLSIRLESIKNVTGFIKTDTTVDTLIAKYYVLVTPTNPSENKYFSYVIAAAQKTTSPISGNDTISPIPHPSGGFLLVTKNNSNGKLITSAEFRTILNDYNDSVRFVNGGQNRNVKDYFHPYVSYHPIQEFLKFYQDNTPLFQNENNIEVLLENGSINFNIPIISKLDGTIVYHKCQSPIFIFKEGNSILLDNIDRGLSNYIMKGMNVGRLCPPQCD